MQVDIIKTGDNTYLVNVQCESGERWTERMTETELKSFIVSAYSGDIPDDVKDTINQLSQFQCTA